MLGWYYLDYYLVLYDFTDFTLPNIYVERTMWICILHWHTGVKLKYVLWLGGSNA